MHRLIFDLFSEALRIPQREPLQGAMGVFYFFSFD